MATLLGLYNGALSYIGERRLASVAEARESRRELDEAYTGLVNYVLARGYWRFAMRTTKISYSPSIVPAFGHTRAYEKPVDLVRISKICQDEFLNTPLLHVQEDGNYWFGSDDDIYIQYVSNDAAYGGDLSRWPETFNKYAEAYLASEVAPRLKPEANSTALLATAKMLLAEAQTVDAMAGPTEFAPTGLWSSARGGWGSRRDRGNRGRLIG